MKLGLCMLPMHPPGKPHADSYHQDLETLIKADELGPDEAWIGERFTPAWENISAPDLIIANMELMATTVLPQIADLT